MLGEEKKCTKHSKSTVHNPPLPHLNTHTHTHIMGPRRTYQTFPSCNVSKATWRWASTRFAQKNHGQCFKLIQNQFFCMCVCVLVCLCESGWEGEQEDKYRQIQTARVEQKELQQMLKHKFIKDHGIELCNHSKNKVEVLWLI